MVSYKLKPPVSEQHARKIQGLAEPPRPMGGDFVERLVDELKHQREGGQPLIDEREFPSGKIQTTVIWDAWDRMTLEDRTAIIHRAYEQAEGRDYRDRIALATGLTVPEAHAAGMLPVQIITAVRKDDPVSVEDCRQAMIEEGASILFSKDQPQLRFANLHEAEAACQRLSKRLPNSEPVWVITQDVGRVEDWVHR